MSLAEQAGRDRAIGELRQTASLGFGQLRVIVVIPAPRQRCALRPPTPW